MEDNLKDRLEKELEYAKKKYNIYARDVELMLEGLKKDCFRPVCNLAIMDEVHAAYCGLIFKLEKAIVDIEQKEKEDGK